MVKEYPLVAVIALYLGSGDFVVSVAFVAGFVFVIAPQAHRLPEMPQRQSLLRAGPPVYQDAE